jgi:hypothetical protein
MVATFSEPLWPNEGVDEVHQHDQSQGELQDVRHVHAALPMKDQIRSNQITNPNIRAKTTSRVAIIKASVIVRPPWSDSRWATVCGRHEEFVMAAAVDLWIS